MTHAYLGRPVMAHWARTLDGVALRGSEWGDGTTLLWLHGYASTAPEDRFLQRLASRYRERPDECAAAITGSRSEAARA
jgi:hypothetical protein